jgi:hypothetical protein
MAYIARAHWGRKGTAYREGADMEIQKVRRSGSSQDVCRYRDDEKTLRVMLYNGAVLSIAQSASGERYGEYEEGIKVTLYRRETLALPATLKEAAATLGGVEWDATLIRDGWLSPFDARKLRERAERAEQRLAELLVQDGASKTGQPPAATPAKAGKLLPKMPLPAHLRGKE